MSSEAKFPNFALVNYHAKEPLMKYIVEPVLSNGGLACSFRLGWFGKSGENLDQVWEQLVYLRGIVDGQVCNTPGVAFVLSALSGTVSQKAGFPRKTYPAVAYWVATQDQTFQESYILPKMHSLNLGSTVKQLHSSNNIDKQKMASSLFVVVKDNSESYVRRMADASALLCGGEVSVADRQPLVKVFVKDPRYWAILEEARIKLEQVNFAIQLEKLFS